MKEGTGLKWEAQGKDFVCWLERIGACEGRRLKAYNYWELERWTWTYCDTGADSSKAHYHSGPISYLTKEDAMRAAIEWHDAAAAGGGVQLSVAINREEEMRIP